MTLPRREQLARRSKPLVEVRSPFLLLAEACDVIAREASTISWPCTAYQARPVDFFKDILGIEPWDGQVRVIEAIRDYLRVSVAAGHRVSKSNTAAGIAEATETPARTGALSATSTLGSAPQYVGAYGGGPSADIHGVQRVAEVFAYSRVLTAGEKSRLRRYLNGRYGKQMTG